jgi:group II intron reverse transcriptase/maturase
MIEEYVSFIKRFVESHKGVKVQNLSSQVNKLALLDMHRKMDRRKAKGVDGVSKDEYELHLDENLDALVGRLKRDTYNPKPTKRTYIPKADGKLRPLGISSYEGKLVEANIAELLMAVYEPKFLGCSYGFRPGRSCHDAISDLKKQINLGKVSYVVEVDIKSFFDSVDHEWLIRFLEHDIADKKLIRLIKKFLKAGVMDQGKFLEREEGTPQGSGLSPVLANIYLHYVIDVWFGKTVKKECRGSAGMVRYCDDFVCTFQYKQDAEKFMADLIERLKKFKLEVAPDKTKLLEFGRFAAGGRAKRSEGKPETFNFLGFTVYCSKTLNGKYSVKLRSDRKRVAKKLKALKEWLNANRTTPIVEIVKRLNISLKGYYNYYYVMDNTERVRAFVYRVEQMLFRMLNRRSQRRSYTWTEFHDASKRWFPLVMPSAPRQI